LQHNHYSALFVSFVRLTEFSWGVERYWRVFYRDWYNTRTDWKNSLKHCNFFIRRKFSNQSDEIGVLEVLNYWYQNESKISPLKNEREVLSQANVYVTVSINFWMFWMSGNYFLYSCIFLIPIGILKNVCSSLKSEVQSNVIFVSMLLIQVVVCYFEFFIYIRFLVKINAAHVCISLINLFRRARFIFEQFF